MRLIADMDLTDIWLKQLGQEGEIAAFLGESAINYCHHEIQTCNVGFSWYCIDMMIRDQWQETIDRNLHLSFASLICKGDHYKHQPVA